MHKPPVITEHNAVFAAFTRLEERASDATAHKRMVQAASSEVAEREAAYLRALNPPRVQVERPSLKQPVLPDGFADQAAAIDQAIFNKGVAINRDKLLALGKQRFQELLQRERTCRAVQRVGGTRTDFSSWASTEFAFAKAGALTTQVPKRKTSEQLAGSGLDREEAARIAGFADLWKTRTEYQAVRDVYAFHDLCCSLVFGQSLLERLSADGRLRSRLFCGGTGANVGYFQEWLSILTGSHFAVTLGEPLAHLFVWLMNEPTPLPDAAHLARDWFGVRSPSPGQVKVAQAVVQGFLLDHREWSLWNFVGRRTRTALDEGLLETCRKELSKRFKAIAAFHEVLRYSFNKPVTQFGEAYFQFDAQAHRAFIDSTVAKLLQTVSALAAQAVEETHAVVGRFEDSLLIEGKPKQKAALVERITSKLAVAFPSSAFNVTIEEVA